MSALSEQFGELLADRPDEPVSFERVKAARAKGQTYLMACIALALGRYCDDDDPACVRIRAQLLKPVLDQNNAIASYLSRRRPTPDVDPQTGNELPDPDPTDDGLPVAS